MKLASNLSISADDASTIAQSAADASIGDKALKGSVWMIAATGAAKLLGFACQLALAWFLTKKDYGIYAIAISLSIFLSVLRDGGLPQILQQKGNRIDFFAGPVFWMMLAINAGTALLIALIAEPAAAFYGIPELAGVIRLFALTIPLSVVPSILSVRLIVDLRFRELGLVQVASAVARNLLLLFFAWSGFGARSLLLPVLVTSLTDSLLLWLMTRYSPWTMPPKFTLWGELFASGGWILLGTFSIAIGNNGSYFLLGKFLPSDLVGTYYFAYQLVVQLGTLLSDNVYQVLIGSFSRMGTDFSRMRATVQRALNMVVLMGAVASLSIAAIYEPLERVLWHGKWAAASNSVHILAVAWPAAAAVSVLRALQMATGRFRQWGIVTSISAITSVAGTTLGGYWGGSPAAAAIGFGLGALLGAAINAGGALPLVGLSPLRTAFPVLRPWLIIVVSAACARYVGTLFTRTWMDVIFAACCFCVLGFLGLKLGANDSLQLVEHSLRRIVQGHRRIAR